MKKMKSVISLLLVVAMLFSCVGCAGKKDEAPEPDPETKVEEGAQKDEAPESGEAGSDDLSDKKVALVLFGTTFDFFVYIGAKANQVAEENGVKLDILSANDVTKAADLMTQTVTSKYDAVITIGVEMFLPSYQEINEAGIPLITYDSFIDGMDAYARVGSNNYDLGAQGAEGAIQYLEEHNLLDKEVIVLNCPEAETMNQRSLGFMETLTEKYPDIQIDKHDLSSMQSTAEGCQTYLDNVLVSKPRDSVAIVWAANAGMAMGAIAAVEVAGRTEIGVMGIDNEEGQLTALQSGAIYKATIAQQPVKIGEECMLAAIRALKGEKTGDVVVPGQVGRNCPGD